MIRDMFEIVCVISLIQIACQMNLVHEKS
jgi:hypothetical protein